MKTTIIIGATGLVGNKLVHLLLNDDQIEKVVVFVRRSLTLQHPKLEEHIIDFDKPETWMQDVKGDILFSAMGTTIKQAGSKAQQYKVDYSYQYEFAQAAAYNHVPVYALVSAASSSPDSNIFYSRIKGELERDIKSLPFKSITILQPGLLTGARQDERFGEKLGYRVLKALNTIGLFKKYRPVEGRTVALALRNAAFKASAGVHTYTLDELFKVEEEN